MMVRSALCLDANILYGCICFSFSDWWSITLFAIATLYATNLYYFNSNINKWLKWHRPRGLPLD